MSVQREIWDPTAAGSDDINRAGSAVRFLGEDEVSASKHNDRFLSPSGFPPRPADNGRECRLGPGTVC